MSWHCLPELVEDCLLGGSWDGGPSVRSKKNHTVGRYCSDASAMDGWIGSLSGTTLPPSTGDRGKVESMSSVEASPARTSQLQAKEQESPENGQDSGVTWRELSAKFDPDTCSWKTAHSLFGEDLDWSCLTLPKWGMLRDGELWERTTPALHTKGNGAGSWPTASARDWKDTPGMAKVGVNPDGSKRTRIDQLARAVYRDHQIGTLSPDWVELLMGWPMGWTSMEPLTELRVTTVEQWQDGTWELGVPRVGVKIKHRAARLKAIGNGQVPQAAVMA